MIKGIGVALQGLLRSQENMAQSADRVAKGDISAKSLVDAKLDANDVKVQTKNLKLQLETEEELLDILA